MPQWRNCGERFGGVTQENFIALQIQVWKNYAFIKNVFYCFKDSVVSVDFSFDGNYVATADMAGFIQVWKLSNIKGIWSTNIGDLSVSRQQKHKQSSKT